MKARQKPTLQKKTLYVLVSLLIITLAIVILLATGVLYIGIKEPSKSVAVYRTDGVCGEAEMDEYRDIYSKEEDVKKESFDSLVSKIKQKAGYKDDIVCQYIVMSQASYGTTDEFKTAKHDFNKILGDSAAIRGVYENDDIRKASISIMESENSSINSPTTDDGSAGVINAG